MPEIGALGALGCRFTAGLAHLLGPLGQQPLNASGESENPFVFRRPNGPNGCFFGPQEENA